MARFREENIKTQVLHIREHLCPFNKPGHKVKHSLAALQAPTLLAHPHGRVRGRRGKRSPHLARALGLGHTLLRNTHSGTTPQHHSQNHGALSHVDSNHRSTFQFKIHHSRKSPGSRQTCIWETHSTGSRGPSTDVVPPLLSLGRDLASQPPALGWTPPRPRPSQVHLAPPMR